MNPLGTPESNITIDSNEIVKPSLEGSLDFEKQPCLTDLCKEDKTTLLENNSTLVRNIITIDSQNGGDFNKTNKAKFKLQFKKEVLNNPDFTDGDIPEKTQKQLENETNIDYSELLDDLMLMDKSEFIRLMHTLSKKDLKKLLEENEIVKLDGSGRNKDKNILDRMEDIENLYNEKNNSTLNEDDNLPTNENGEEVTVNDIWPEGIPKEYN